MLGYRSPLSVDWHSPVNWSESLNRSLLAWWIVVPHMSGGTRWHELVSGLAGTLTNMDPATDWITSGSQLAASAKLTPWGLLDFDGSNDYGDCGTASILNISGPLSIAAIVSSPGSSGEPAIAGKGSYSGSGYHLVHSGGGGNVNGIYFHCQGGFALSTSTINDSVPHQAVGINTGAALQIAIDGKIETTTVTSVTPNASGTNFEMGRRPGGSSYFTGRLTDVRVWGRALSAGEVAALYSDTLDFNRRTLRRWSRRFFGLGTAQTLFRRNLMMRTGSRSLAQ